jgi:hypothetical protein
MIKIKYDEKDVIKATLIRYEFKGGGDIFIRATAGYFGLKVWSLETTEGLLVQKIHGGNGCSSYHEEPITKKQFLDNIKMDGWEISKDYCLTEKQAMEKIKKENMSIDKKVFNVRDSIVYDLTK